MISLSKSLPTFFLLLQIALASDLLLPSFEESDLKLTELLDSYSQLKTLEGKKPEYGDFFLISINYPSKISFRPSKEPDFKADGVIERLTSDERNKKICSFPALKEDAATKHFKLRSMKNDLEIFQIINIFKDSKENFMEIFVVNMTDCQFSRNEILKGYDYIKSGGTFLVLKPWDYSNFELFSFNGKDECGTFACKRIFCIYNRTFSDPIKFSLLDSHHQDQQLTFISAAEDGYFAVVRKGNELSLLSLTSNGDSLGSITECADKGVRFLKIATNYDLFSFCYILDESPQKVICMQRNKKLYLNTNLTMALEYPPRYLSLRNLERGGFLLLSVFCANEAKDRCEEHEVKLSRFGIDGAYSELTKFKDEGCVLRPQQQFLFFEEEEKTCLYYVCSCKKKEGEGFDQIVKTRCF